jgi:CcmD family protein
MMKLLSTLALILVLAAPIAAWQPPSPPAASAPKAPQAAQDEFVPVNAPISPEDTIPAQRLVGIAYGFIWVVVFAYVWSVRSRLSKVERDLDAVSRRVPARK